MRTFSQPDEPRPRGPSTRSTRQATARLLWVVLLVTTMAACTSGDPAPCCGDIAGRTTAIVVVHHQGELAPQLAQPDRDALREDALARGAEAVAYVIAAGRPADEIVDLEPRRPNGERENGHDRQATLVDGRMAEVDRAVDRAAREASDLDVLRALDTAARTRAGRVVVLSAGLSTRDPFDIQVTGWDRDPDTLAGELRATGALPDLSGREVVFSGLGRTTAPQPPLGVSEQAQLRRMWVAICSVTGATCRISDTPRAASPSVSPLPADVVAVPVMRTTPGPDGSATLSVPSPLLFAPDSCAIPDRAEAARLLSDLAAQLHGGGHRVAISGRTAPVGGTGVELATCRARAVADLLRTELRVPAVAIGDVRGDGSLLDPPEASRDASGQLDPKKLIALRRVIFIVTPTEEVRLR